MNRSDMIDMARMLLKQAEKDFNENQGTKAGDFYSELVDFYIETIRLLKIPEMPKLVNGKFEIEKPLVARPMTYSIPEKKSTSLPIVREQEDYSMYNPRTPYCAGCGTIIDGYTTCPTCGLPQ